MILLAVTIPEAVVSALIQSGPFGAVVLWFMWRDGKKLDAMTEALNHLIQMTHFEVMTRPRMDDRSREEMTEILAAMERRRKAK